MKLVKLNEAEKFNNSDKCTVWEYPLGDKDIDCATAVIKGRYPDKGYCMNEECKELIYVVEGNGTLNKKEETIHFQKGDVILIDKGEAYFWEANCNIVMPCTPSWYTEQYRIIEE